MRAHNEFWPLTQYQQERRETQRIADAQLLERGGWVDAQDRIQIGPYQMQRLATEHDTPADPWPPLDGFATFDDPEWLDQPIIAAGETPAVTSQLDYPLRLGSLVTRRDLLGVGRAYAQDIPHIAERRMGFLEALLGRSDDGPQIPWKDNPTAGDIAQFCSNLGQVHVGALGLGRPAKRVSVEEVLHMSPDKRDTVFRPLTERITSPPTKTWVDRLANIPELWAMAFHHERRHAQLYDS